MKKITIDGYEVEMSLDGVVVIPNEVQSISKDIFNDVLELTRIEIPENVCVESFAFRNCRELSSIKVSKGVSIGVLAFSDCTGLSNIKIPAGVSIGAYAFEGCTGLSNIEIQESVSIEAYALDGCTGLAKVEISAGQDLSASGLNPGVNVIKRAYHFIPSLPKRCLLTLPVDRDYSTFGVGKKLASLVLLCLHRNWGMESQIHGLPPEMGLMVLSFMNIEVFGREELVVPGDKRLAVNLLKPSFKIFEALKQEKWFKDFRDMPMQKGENRLKN